MGNTEIALPFAAVEAGAGDARWWFGQHVLVKAGARETAGRYSLLEVLAPPHYAAPLHLHANEDEAFWMLDGAASFEIGGRAVGAGVGDYLLAPRGTPHRWSAGPAGARVLFLFTPGGVEEYVAATSVPALAPTPPPADVLPPHDAAEIARRFGTHLLDAAD